ncbi:iron complex outermembrane receptor protein [Fulvimonas soli]|uniref:Iron complex outermembrane receptor protein n=2 Tax=Fulvimonas soli TaxID=155197 RepID=A0A316I508_9GAMM|nr:TonB-dependent copper receptor [Fulvimonas soli]PWK82360.1 iron complex outermembrane receptor protein [Fulvimonas soli]
MSRDATAARPPHRRLRVARTPGGGLAGASRRSLPLALAAALGAAACTAARAGTDVPAAPQDLPPVVVTAPMQDAPLTVVTDPRAPRQPVPASDGADFLKTIPGFATIRKGGSNGDPVLRGMGGSRLGIRVDGGQIAGGCPSRMDPPTAYVAPELYDRVTVVKGPETVVDGPGNSAGVVRFERDFERYAAPDHSADASVLVGSRGRNDQNLDLRAGDPAGYLGVRANHTHAQDYADGDGHRVHSRYDRWNADATVGWTPDDDTRVQLAVGKGDGQAAYAFSGMDGAQFLRESAALDVAREHLTRHWAKLEVRAYTNYADHVMDNYTLRHPDPAGMMPMAMASNVARRTSGGRIAGTWRWDEALELVAGLDGSGSVHTVRNGGPPGSAGDYRDLPRVRDARMDDVGAFGELRWTFAPRQRLVTGARLDRAHARGYGLAAGPGDGMGMDGGMGSMGGMAMGGAAAATRDADRASTLPAGFVRYERDLAALPATFYAGLGHVQRFPDYWELFGGHVDVSLPGFRSLAPEKTTQLDVGLQYRDARLKAWVSGYAGVVRDFILVHYPAGAMGGGSAGNVQARIAGGEAGATYAFAAHWKGDATLGYAWGENRSEHRPLPQMPPLEARLGLAYARGAWSVGGLWRIVAAQHRVAAGEGNIVGQDLGPSAGFGVFSLNAGWRAGARLALSAGIDNLFDRTYAEHLNAAPEGLAGYVNTVRVNEPGRTAWLKVALQL